MRRTTAIAVALLLLAEGLLAWYLRGLYDAELDQVLSRHQTELTTSLRSVVDGYGHLVDVVMRTAIDRPEVRDLLAAAQADPSQARRLRGHLFRLLSPTYAILREHDLRVLQFVRPDGVSFLRFNRPDLFDDDIARDRPLLGRVLAGGGPGRGFENGRVYPGFRYAYPMHRDGGLEGDLLGAVDFGVAFDAVRSLLQNAGGEHGTSSRFILRRDMLELVGHPSARALFRPATLNPAYVTEEPDASLGDSSPSLPMPVWVAELDQQLARDGRVQAALAAGRPHGVLACMSLDTCYAVAFEPVPDSLDRVAGFVVTYTPAPELATLRDRLLLAFVVGSLLVLAAGVTLRRALAARRRLRIVSEHMGEGLYVIDTAGVTLYANTAACEMLGYASGDLIGQVAHDLIHARHGTETVPAEACPMRLCAHRGETYRSDQELFRHKDGRLIPVSVVSSPLREEGEVTGTVVLFRDISAEQEARVRLRQAEIAFSHLAEAVVVTDADARIQAVNRAFTQITGYREEEVLGQNPRILASGRHDARFYEQMWEALRGVGYWEGEVWNRRKNGEAYPETLKITAVRDANQAIVGFVSVFSDITELRAKEERLRHLAYHDQLTGLYNRNAFLQIFEHALHRAQDRQVRLALLYLDLDRFKRINDSLGHLVGDGLLKEVARRIRAALRVQDEVARLGGDEFVILIEDIDEQAATARLAHSLLETIRAPLEVEGKSLYVTISIGVCVYPEDGIDPTTLLKNADAAMYLAKQSGRDGYRYFTAAMAREADARYAMETSLRPALEAGQMRILYQPKVALADGQVIGVEALLRWQHPSQGLLAPERFLGAAGETGLMQPLTQWVIGEVSRQCARWRAEGIEVGRIACNLDPGIYHPAALETMLLETVAAAGITPADIDLEILETGMLRDLPSQGLWHRLVAHGFDLSIDDFGAGESSLTRIKELPVRTLKIDQGFVRDLETNAEDRSIVHTIIAMTRTLGKQALAEGVETDAQVRFLIEAGCDAIQGYWFSPPVPPEAIPDLVRGHQGRDRLAALRQARAL